MRSPSPPATARAPSVGAPTTAPYRDAVSGEGPVLKAMEIDRRLASERLRRGRGFSRAKDRPLWAADVASLPVGAVLVHEAHGPCLVGRDTLQAFTFAGWGAPFPRPSGEVAVLTPPMSVAALDAASPRPCTPRR